MKADISTILQTLTAEASTVLTHSIAEAGRRSHGQTTPLHVAATLLAPQNGLLRQACIRSNPNSSHPLQCRALELCFSVALERLPSAQGEAAGAEPPVSNALMAALKRAQAQQRRGCPEQQQQPLLAVKVELEQLVISILDDPSVSRVMREASFSSPAVKATIEKTLSASGNSSPAISSSIATTGLGFRPSPTPAPGSGLIPNRNMYLNPKLQQGGASAPQAGNQRGDEVKRVIEILIRTKKRNPILVGESEPEWILTDLLRRIENKGMIEEAALKNVELMQLGNDLTLDRAQIPSKINDLRTLIENRIAKPDCSGVLLNLGDLKWLVEQPPSSGSRGLSVASQQVVSETGRVAVEEIGKLLTKHGGGAARVWLIGTATCETYMRCQVYYSNMENDWDLQAMPITSKSQQTGSFPRLGTIGNVHGAAQSLSPLKSLMTIPNPSFSHATQNFDSSQSMKCCPQCTIKYKEELAETLTKPAIDSQPENKSETAPPSLPFWLQNTKANDDSDAKAAQKSQGNMEEHSQKQKSQELLTKWKDTCKCLHPTFHSGLSSGSFIAPTPLTVTGLYNSKLLGRHTNPPHLQGPTSLEERNTQPHPMLSVPSLISEPVAREAIDKPGGFIAPAPLTVSGLYNSKLLGRLNNPPKLQGPKILDIGGPQLRPTLSGSSYISKPAEKQATDKPASPVRTELVLGLKEAPETRAAILNEGIRDLISCISAEPENVSIEMQANKLLSSLLDADSFKKLLRNLTEKVWWQKEAASAVATTVTQCKLGNGKQRGSSSKSDVWLLFTGPDRAAKRKIASVLSDVVCGLDPVVISLGAKRNVGAPNTSFRGKTVLDRITEAVRRNQFSVILLEDIHEADLVIRGSIKRAMERGRLTDTHGREISLGSVIFILATNPGPDNMGCDVPSLNEKLTSGSTARGGCQLRLVVNERRRKRRANWLTDDDRPWKPRKDSNSGLTLDLNEAVNEERADSSWNSSDLTVEHDNDRSRTYSHHLQQPLHPAVKELIHFIDNTIVFDPVNFNLIHQRVSSSIKTSFSSIIHNGLSIELEEQAVEKISQGIREGHMGLEEWLENVLVPSFQQLKTRMRPLIDSETDESIIVQLESDEGSSNDLSLGDWLPDKIKVLVDGQCL